MLGIAFRPRLAKIHEHNLFSIDAASTYPDFGYQVKPDSKVNFELIIEHWDEILRFITTIKLGYSKASTLIRRLNSYSRQHPLRKALKELGRIYKTLYILQYMDQPAVRKSVERVLSKVENSNKFAKAISHGNNGTGHPAAADRGHIPRTAYGRRLQKVDRQFNKLLEPASFIGESGRM